MSAAALTTQISLSEEQIDDLLYLARANESSELLSELAVIKEAHMAAEGTLTSEAGILLAAVDPETGNNVLHMAAANGHTGLITSLLPVMLPQLRSTFVCHKNVSGNTPLHWACLNGHLDTVKVLVEQAGADPALVNAAGHDPVFEAEVGGKADVVEWLLRSCAALEEVASACGLGVDVDMGAGTVLGAGMGTGASVDGGEAPEGYETEGGERLHGGGGEGEAKVNGEM